MDGLRASKLHYIFGWIIPLKYLCVLIEMSIATTL